MTKNEFPKIERTVTTKRRVLIVDDSISARYFLHKKLKQAGFETFEAANGIEAFEKLKIGSYDIMLLDLLMPEMSGIELLKIVQKENLNIRTIVISADIQQQVQDECFELGAMDFINKPIEIDVLIEKLNNI